LASENHCEAPVKFQIWSVKKKVKKVIHFFTAKVKKWSHFVRYKPTKKHCFFSHGFHTFFTQISPKFH